MLNKILVFLACFFAILAVVCIFWINIQCKRINSLKEAKTMLEMNNNVLVNRLERERNDALEISRKNRELEALAKHSVGFDWNTDISSDEPTLWLRENAIRVQRDRARAD